MLRSTAAYVLRPKNFDADCLTTSQRSIELTAATWAVMASAHSRAICHTSTPPVLDRHAQFEARWPARNKAGSTIARFKLTDQCRCGPVTRPVAPTSPSWVPVSTRSPTSPILAWAKLQPLLGAFWQLVCAKIEPKTHAACLKQWLNYLRCRHPEAEVAYQMVRTVNDPQTLADMDSRKAKSRR